MSLLRQKEICRGAAVRIRKSNVALWLCKYLNHSFKMSLLHVHTLIKTCWFQVFCISAILCIHTSVVFFLRIYPQINRLKRRYFLSLGCRWMINIQSEIVINLLDLLLKAANPVNTNRSCPKNQVGLQWADFCLSLSLLEHAIYPRLKGFFFFVIFCLWPRQRRRRRAASLRWWLHSLTTLKASQLKPLPLCGCTE